MKSGWTPDRPTIHIDSERDRIDLQSSKIQFQLLMPRLSNGIIPWLNQFGTLYYGTVQQDIYCTNVLNLKVGSIRHLINAEQLERDRNGLPLSQLKETDYLKFYKIQSTAFFMHMMRTALVEAWHWPAMLSWRNNSLVWENGNSRCVATGVTRRDPWQHQTFLYFQPAGVDYNPLDNHNRTAIADDCHLHEVLNLNYQFEFHQPVECNIGMSLDNGDIYLNWIHNGIEDYDNNHLREEAAWSNFLDWRSTHPQRPHMTVITNTPELITDPEHAWTVSVINDTQTDDSLSLLAFREHNRPSSRTDHTLWYRGTDPIDLGDLLFWMDMKHSAFIDINRQFMLYRKHPEFVSCDISVSALPGNK